MKRQSGESLERHSYELYFRFDKLYINLQHEKLYEEGKKVTKKVAYSDYEKAEV